MYIIYSSTCLFNRNCDYHCKTDGPIFTSSRSSRKGNGEVRAPSTSAGRKTKKSKEEDRNIESDRVKLYKKYVIELRAKGVTQEMLSDKR